MAAKKDEKVEVREDPKSVVVEKAAPEEKAAEPVAEATVAKPANTDEKPAKAEDANTVLVQAVRSFEGVEGDKGPRSEPFRVSRQRYADLKANDLVELVDEQAGSDPQ
ncbi:hypothetical protein [Agrobacterium rosae]|uniref:hypothetical protein n=1 Tax=Agrobacterium rosae TaxID=1972867 RepID=UPI002033744C|nr:hypothetical protein [Agrobacterium rosae]MCM2432092.1 hypothetical protein [Agrobacterium rosae]